MKYNCMGAYWKEALIGIGRSTYEIQLYGCLLEGSAYWNRKEHL